MQYDQRPIGLIDSGIGGFSVLKELQQRLPDENIIYLGDSLRMPYGELENAKIIAYADSDIRFLEEKSVKAILLACNTISSLADRLTARVPLFSIIEAGCLSAIENKSEGNIGLIATTATVKNNAYPQKLSTMTDKVQFIQHGTKTLAAVINNYPDAIEMLRNEIYYAIEPLVQQKDIKDLLLGCTHYPIVRETIQAMYPQLRIINPAAKQIELITQYLEENQMFNKKTEQGRTTIYTTGTMADYSIFKSMIRYLNIHCDELQQCKLDIDK